MERIEIRGNNELHAESIQFALQHFRDIVSYIVINSFFVLRTLPDRLVHVHDRPPHVRTQIKFELRRELGEEDGRRVAGLVHQLRYRPTSVAPRRILSTGQAIRMVLAEGLANGREGK